MAKGCPTCGASNRDDAVYCSSCGASIGGAPVQQQTSGSQVVKPVPSVRVISPIAGIPGAPFFPGVPGPVPVAAPFPTAFPVPSPAPGFAVVPGVPGGHPIAIATPTRRSTLSFIVAFIAGLLILANAALLLNPLFFLIWQILFPFVITLGQSLTFAVGVILGLIVIVGSFLLFLGFGITGSIIVFPAAIISFVIGGGFIAGLILGIVAALLAFYGR